MAIICPGCHAKGRRVEMKSVFVRHERRVIDVPCDVYPDGTVVSQGRGAADAAVFRYDCPACGLSTECADRPELPGAPESP